MSIVKAHYIYSVGIISSCCRASLRFIFLCDGHRSQAALKKASMDITASVSFWKGLPNSTKRQLKQSNNNMHLNVGFSLVRWKKYVLVLPPVHNSALISFHEGRYQSKSVLRHDLSSLLIFVCMLNFDIIYL